MKNLGQILEMELFYIYYCIDTVDNKALVLTSEFEYWYCNKVSSARIKN